MGDPTKNAQHEIICELQGKCQQLEEERDEAYRKDEIKMREYNLLVQENRALSTKCAEMREALELALGVGYTDCGWQLKAEHALSTDCGKGFIHVSELLQTMQRLKFLRDEIDYHKECSIVRVTEVL